MAFPSLSTASCVSELPEKVFHPDSSFRFRRKRSGKQTAKRYRLIEVQRSSKEINKIIIEN